MNLFKEVKGVNQVGNEFTVKLQFNRRAILVALAWALITALMLSGAVVASCDDTYSIDHTAETED